MAQIGLNISISGLTGFLIIRWVRASNTGAQVGRNATPSTLTFPYDAVYTIPDLQPVVYIVQLWRSDDGTALDQLIKDWSIDASKFTETTISTYQYVVDRGQSGTDPDWADPANLDVTLVDQRLDGFTKSQMLVHEAGFGNKLDSEYNLVAGGGITLLGGKTFDSGVAWFISTAATSEGTLPGDTGGTAMFAGVETLVANRDVFISSSDNLYNKLIIANWAGNVGTLTFPDLALIPDDTHITFNTHGGSQKYLKLQFDSGDIVRFLNQLVNIIYLARCEKISLYFKAGLCYVIDYDGNAIRRGTIIPDYDATRDTDNGCLLYADEATGVLNNSDYPGLYDFVNQLSGDAVCTLGTGVGQWSYDSGGGVYPNKRKYGIDTGTTTFRVPHLSGVVIKMSDTPGVYEAAQVGEISQNFDFKQGKSDDNEAGVSGEYLRKPGASGGTSYGNTTVAFIFNSGQENKVKSYSQKPFVVL